MYSKNVGKDVGKKCILKISTKILVILFKSSKIQELSLAWNLVKRMCYHKRGKRSNMCLFLPLFHLSALKNGTY